MPTHTVNDSILKELFYLNYRAIDKRTKSDIFYHMQNNTDLLTKQAIEAALKGNWKDAIKINTQLLEVKPDNLDTLARLGRAHLQTKEFSKAKKLFKKILDVDPINTIALKNYKLAKEKIAVSNKAKLDPKVLLEEPGTSTTITLPIDSTKARIQKILCGQYLKLKLTRYALKFYKENVLVGELTNTDIIQSLREAKTKDINVKATVTNIEKKHIRIVLHATANIFSSTKQTVRPYLKKGSIEEPALIVATTEETE